MNIEEQIISNYYFRVKNTANQVPNGRFLFNQTYYLQNQPNLSLLSFELRDAQLSQSVALVHFFTHNAEAISPARATFGGIETAPELPPELLDEFLRRIHSFLIRRQVTGIRLTNYPLAYDPETAQQITAALLRQGYVVSYAEVNYHIDITSHALEQRIHPSERRRLRKCRQVGFIFAEEKTPDLAQVHAFIAQARLRKGFPMSLSLEAFQELFVRMPDVYRVFTVKKGHTIAALTVTVQINDQILYNFYPADNELFMNYSPTVLLTVELYKLAQNEGYTLLDLGIATANGKPNYGLMRFKKNLGAEASLRFSFFKSLS